jgi:hypothetical protein
MFVTRTPSQGSIDVETNDHVDNAAMQIQLTRAKPATAANPWLLTSRF